MSFSKNGAILTDSLYGYTDVVNNLDEGRIGGLKDILLTPELESGSEIQTSYTVSAEHHGKQLRVANIKGAIVTLPEIYNASSMTSGVKPGFCVEVLLAVTNTTNNSLEIHRGGSSDTLCGCVGGNSIATTTVSLSWATAQPAFSVSVKCEVVELPNSAGSCIWMITGDSGAAPTAA